MGSRDRPRWYERLMVCAVFVPLSVTVVVLWFVHWAFIGLSVASVLFIAGLCWHAGHAFKKWERSLAPLGLRVCPRCGGSGYEEGPGGIALDLIRCSLCDGAKAVPKGGG